MKRERSGARSVSDAEYDGKGTHSFSKFVEHSNQTFKERFLDIFKNRGHVILLMWTLKLRFYNPENILIKLAKKYNIILYGYPLSSYQKNNKLYLNAAGNIIGDDKEIPLFLKELKKSTLIKNMEIKNDFSIIQIEQPLSVSKLYAPELIHIEPVIVSNKGYQEYYLGSWDRKILSDIINLKLENIQIEILKFKQEIIGNISIKGINPSLTEKQKIAFNLAHKEGYYEFPRNSELDLLSKKMRISISTYQAHLRKAEKKIMNFFYQFSK
jgi:predicted DNA binding protein